jgi:hypothetical protein
MWTVMVGSRAMRLVAYNCAAASVVGSAVKL